MSVLDLTKKYIKKSFRLLGLHLNKNNFYHSDDVLLEHILNQFKIDTIIDGGANEGQYAVNLLESGFKGKIYSFEPIPSVYERLKKNTLKYPNQWEAINLGLGSKTEELNIHVTQNSVSSSLYHVGENSLEAEPNTKVVNSEAVKITMLDQFFIGNKQKENVLLKLDIQGYELEALKGSLNVLKNTKVVQAELSLVSLYDGAPLYDEVINYLKREGFEIFTFIPVFRNPHSGRLLQMDGIFVNSKL